MKYLLMAVMATLVAPPGEKAPVVHEWGTFTSVAGEDGVPIIWRPLAGPTDLPSFVYKPDRRRGDLTEDKAVFITTVRMETPVLYFYSTAETEMRVRVDFPSGAITEWYPRAKSLRPKGIDWGRVRVRPGAPDEFPKESAPSHYYPARETDASPIQVKSPGLLQDEKFLFYRGVGWFDLPLRVSLNNGSVVLKNLGQDPVQAIVFEKREGKFGFRLAGTLKDEAVVARPELSGSDVTAELERLLVASGLYEKEARAMLKTWRDSWFEEGLRVFYLVPRAAVDKILPLTLDPKPDDLVRVFVGRAEILTPQMEKMASEALRRAGSDRAALVKELEPFGRFSEPLVRRITSKLSSAEVPNAAQNLLRN